MVTVRAVTLLAMFRIVVVVGGLEFVTSECNAKQCNGIYVLPTAGRKFDEFRDCLSIKHIQNDSGACFLDKGISKFSKNFPPGGKITQEHVFLLCTRVQILWLTWLHYLRYTSWFWLVVVGGLGNSRCGTQEVV